MMVAENYKCYDG